VTTHEGQHVAVLKKNDFFGEMSIMHGSAGIRKVKMISIIH